MTYAVEEKVKYNHTWYIIESITVIGQNKYADAIRQDNKKKIEDFKLRRELVYAISARDRRKN